MTRPLARAAARAPVAAHAVAAVAALAASAPAPARAEPTHRDAEHRFQLAVPASFERVRAAESQAADRRDDRDTAADAPASTRQVVAFRDPRTDAVVAVTRMDHPNPRAWRKNTRAGYYDRIERGVREATTGYRRLARRVHLIGIVPALDLQLRHERDGRREVVTMRFLFFRRYTLVLALSADARAHRRLGPSARAIADSFAPYFRG